MLVEFCTYQIYDSLRKVYKVLENFDYKKGWIFMNLVW